MASYVYSSHRYDQSLLKNLRILQQTMWDFERVYKVIGLLHRSNHDAMQHLLILFFVLCFEYKSGAINVYDLEYRTSRSLIDAMSAKDKPQPLRTVGKKYPGFDIYGSILSDDTVSAILVRGVIDSDAIATDLSQSPWFVSNSEPSWVTVWRSFERPDADVELAAKTMIEEFGKRHYKTTGEILHLFGQMLFLADLGFSGRDRAQTVSDCEAYVDDLKLGNELEPPSAASMDEIRFGSYRGLGFSQNETEEFKKLFGYIQEQRINAEADRYAVKALDMIALMKIDPSAFVNEITYHRDVDSRYVNKPVLAQACVQDFADAMLGLEPIAFREVSLGLGARYDQAKLAKGRELEDERDWAEALEKALLEKSAALGAFVHDRIARNIGWTFGEKLAQLRKYEAQEAKVP